jgi:hypothetical protein
MDARTVALPGSGLVVTEIGPSGVTVLTSGTSGTARPLDDRSLFEIGSVTKTFTATILASMVLDGSVKLDDPVSKYLPANVHVPSFKGKAITLLNLATQHSGLPRLPDNLKMADRDDPYATYSAADMYAFLGKYRLTRAPGASFEYSNFGIGLLGQALVNRAHQPYADLLRERIFAPLGMHDTAIVLSPEQLRRFTLGRSADGDAVKPWTFQAIAPAGALRSSASDLVKYARCYMGQGTLAKTCAFAALPRATMPNNRIGLVWWTGDEHHIVHHGGDTAGYHAAIAVSADRTRAVIALADGGLPVEDIALHALAPDIPVAAPPAAGLALDPITLDTYVGAYANKDVGTLTVAHGGDGLTIALTGQSASRIYATGKDAFVSHIVDARFKFTHAADGSVNAVVLLQNGQTVVFVRPGATPPAAADTDMFAPVVTLDAATLTSYVGDYTSAVGTFYVTLSGTQISLRLASQSALPVYPSAKDRFYYKIVNATVDFGRDASGNVTTLTLHQAGNDVTATKK